ncbi:coil containing protein [Vibrio phage 1.015.O._10N.222.51.E5]|nr:coil containing protein [Vibrio phage 1.015.O._10N.222.51.E5]AUR83415.1 coil containing protein [Vibrio phage 1.034.O._10N.261.46.B7]AUR83483.1 coil containing protein [Vibrio phage 1.034.X._10N.261.46.B7]AUR90221.1 coil containing protein [Vibrio phage 1.139.A._10N.261.48.C6]AUR90288.1 coil containing protein [Vibrio phage 1.139.B._10N.261.48.C6]AUR95609.1 coil containing protein [Vibrio phage 1.209.O._10N.222.52.B2]
MRYTNDRQVSLREYQSTEDIEECMKRRLKALKQRCRSKGWECDLTVEDMYTLYTSRHCFYSGVLLAHGKSSQHETPAWNMATIDRINPDRGYVKGNVVPCSYEFNLLKGALEGRALRCTPSQFITGMQVLLTVEREIHTCHTE